MHMQQMNLSLLAAKSSTQPAFIMMYKQ